MTAQVYQKETINFFNISNTYKYGDPIVIKTYDFYIGGFKPMTVVKNDSNEFISLGGSNENALEYEYQGTGVTDFTFNILAPQMPNLHSSTGTWELFIEGDKSYSYPFAKQSQFIFNKTVSVVATKGKRTKFKFNLEPGFMFYGHEDLKYYFLGDENIIYSSITAKFIPDLKIEEKSEPILITEDTQLTLNRRHIVKAPILKTLNLSMDENCKVGDWIEIKNMDLGNFQINSGENIDILMNGLITRVKNGYIRSKKRGDFIRLECMETSPRIIFSDTNTIGSFTII